ncbi:hypothetical protein [Namhaeicola litoreus]|uniref:DUF4142 domain-containing protein n=1 Tax=Namhaeicola litoreus TaxID=1052145 RepID=A0ABW3XZW6_9FLAO
MIKKFLFFVFLGLLNVHAQQNLAFVRNEFHKNTEQSLKNILNLTLTEGAEYNQILAYVGASNAKMASYVSSPISKLKYFNKGKAKLNESLSNIKTVESTYLRLLIQLNAPSFLNYNDFIEEDLSFFEEHIKTDPLPNSFKKEMVDNLKAGNTKSDLNSRLNNIKF